MANLAVVFDIDGTLVTFNFDIQGTRRALLGELASRGFDTAGLGLTSPTQSIIDSAREQVHSGRVSADFAEIQGRLYSLLDTFELESAPSTTVFPKTLETLEHLRTKGVKMGVLTNSGRKGTKAVMEMSGLRNYFEFCLTRDDVEAMKPRAEGIKKAAALLGVQPKDLYYVGDSLYDIEAAKAAGARAISVATGNYSAQRLRDHGSDHVISSIAELPSLLAV